MDGWVTIVHHPRIHRKIVSASKTAADSCKASERASDRGHSRNRVRRFPDGDARFRFSTMDVDSLSAAHQQSQTCCCSTSCTPTTTTATATAPTDPFAKSARQDSSPEGRLKSVQAGIFGIGVSRERTPRLAFRLEELEPRAPALPFCLLRAGVVDIGDSSRNQERGGGGGCVLSTQGYA